MLVIPDIEGKSIECDSAPDETWIISTSVHSLTLAAFRSQMHEWISARVAKAVFFCEVRMLIEAHERLAFAKVLHRADLRCADGRPIYWCQRLLGRTEGAHIRGADAARLLLADCEKYKWRVGFFGSTQETLQKLSVNLTKEFPALEVSYLFAPPFASVEALRREDYATEISQSGVDLLFVGLGCPKQEEWIISHLEKLSVPMLGIGAAFDFLAKTKPEAPRFLISLGLEWLVRLLSEPRRLWSRYLYNNPRFVFLFLRQILTGSR